MSDQDRDQQSGEEPKQPQLYAQGEPGNFRGLPGEISEVTGRKAQGGRRGLVALDRFSLRLEQDGRELEFGPPDDGPEQRAEFVTEIFAHSFGRNDRQQGTWTPMCPICLSDGPMTDEHIPQGPLGGSEMTMTCRPCNNGLGSVVETELEHWYDNALVGARFAHEDVPGARRVPRLLALKGPDGFALIPEGGDLPPDVDSMLRSGSFTMTFRPPDSLRYRLALLKHAYLAACLYLGYVPGIPEAEEIRHDLIAARNTPKRDQPPSSRLAERLKFYRSGRGRQGPPLAIVAARRPGEDPEPLISLAGTLFVSWPFSTLPPRNIFRILPMFD
jgi:hypothetical protein